MYYLFDFVIVYNIIKWICCFQLSKINRGRFGFLNIFLKYFHGVLKNKIHDIYADYKKNFPTDAHHQIFFWFFFSKGTHHPKI